MSLPRSVADVLNEHDTLKVEGIDRMYLSVYQPRLQYDQGVVNFFRFHRGHTFASSALMQPISEAFITDVERFVKLHRVPLITFRKEGRTQGGHRAAAPNKWRSLSARASIAACKKGSSPAKHPMAIAMSKTTGVVSSSLISSPPKMSAAGSVSMPSRITRWTHS